MYHRKVLVLLTLGFTLIAAGCDDPVVEPVDQDLTSGVLVRSISGQLVSRAEMEYRTEELARAVALALADETLRTAIYEAMITSKFAEGKLHFASLFDEAGGALRDEMSLKTGASISELGALLDGVLDLEFYMPVDEHRAQWRGDSDLIVATALDDDGSIPIAYDLEGNQVELDAEVAPLIPTLVLVPAEQDFSEVRSEPEFASSYSGGDGVYMTYSTIWDDYEGWMMGDPEFEVHAFIPNAEGDLEDVSCAGADASGSYFYNQDAETTWTGEVKLISESDLGIESEADSSFVEFQVWENDYDACTYSSGMPPWGSTANWAALAYMTIDAAAITFFILVDEPVLAFLVGEEFLRNGYVFATSLNNDDLVGVIEWPPADCWPESTGPIFGYIRSPDTGTPIRGGAKLDNTYAVRSTVCDLSASMTGPTAITTCPTMLEPDPPAEYSASYYGGGSGTATYQWVLDGYHESTSQYFTIPNEDLSAGSHHLEVIVNRNGQQSVAVKDIQVTAEPFCGGMDLQ